MKTPCQPGLVALRVGRGGDGENWVQTGWEDKGGEGYKVE